MSKSLSRAFTTRRAAKKDADMSPKRSLTTKYSISGTIRNKISAPVELLSTTNMLSYNAPDIYPSSSSSKSSLSGDDSDRSPLSVSTAMTSPDTSSVESSPTSPKPNHLSCYFGARSTHSGSGDDAPTIPKRAPSHTKKNSEILARKRSTSRQASRQNSTSTARSSFQMFSPNPDTVEHNPFGPELAQVSELAEEYAISKPKLTVVDEEEQELVSRGLFKFRAEDYMSEIQGLFSSAFGDARPTMPSLWI